MKTKIEKILALRQRQHTLIQKLAEVDAKICEALCEVITEHGPAAGLDDEFVTASVRPKS